MRISRFLLLMVAFAAGTAAVGWWAVPVIAIVWAILTRNERSHPLLVGFAAMWAWGELLAIAAMRGPVMELATVIGGVMSIGAAGAICLTILYPGLVAAAAAGLTRGVIARPDNTSAA